MSETNATIKIAPDSEWYPLSSSQRQLWVLEQTVGTHAAYIESLGYKLTGVLDSHLLRQSFELLLTHHESLRTAICEIDGVPQQRPMPPKLNWAEVTIADTEEVQAELHRFTNLPFDLSTGYLFRVLLIHSATNEHLLVMAVHHIAVDGFSLSLIMNQIASTYSSLCGGFVLPERPSLQYKDYAYWEQGQKASKSLKGKREYWLKKLSGDLETLELPTDRAHPAVRSFQGKTLRHEIANASLTVLKELCKKERTTFNAGLLAVLRALFHRYTGQTDFCIGTTVLGRPVLELLDQIGYYVNPVALRDNISPELPFRELLRSTGRTLIDALENGGYPFDELVTDLKVRPVLHRNPLFDVMVQFDSGWGDVSRPMSGIQFKRFEVPNSHSKMDLTLFIRENPTGLNIAAEFSTDVFESDRIACLLHHFETLLNSATKNPDTPISLLQMVSFDEQKSLLSSFNQTAFHYDLNTPIHQLFERQVSRTPNRVATVDSQQQLTYEQLDAKASSLALYLKSVGVGPGVIVALLMERSVDLIVAILGILKAGGCYLPLNLKEPSDRLSEILNDSGAVLTIINSDWAHQKLNHQLTTFDLRRQLEKTSKTYSDSTVNERDAIYCIFTSGSTGLPNGVVIEHRSVVNRLTWMMNELSLTQDDVFLQKTPYSFDVSVWELFLPLLIGAKQVMLNPGVESDPFAIKSAIVRYGVTIIHFVPAMLNQYLSVVDQPFSNIRHCICSGEALDIDLASRFLNSTQSIGTQLHNYYGPTEATVDVSRCKIEARQSLITIGCPAPNNRLYVLEPSGQVCPVGVTGELWIAGIQVGRGYLNRPALTADRFTADPFFPGERMYRTGDLARWMPSGEVLYLGRKDSQIKLRGYRIELSEIESVLCSCEGVSGAVVLMQRSSGGGDFLCAYLAGQEVLSLERLKEKLALKLPDYMIPSHYCYMNTFPLSRSGKVDRKVLSQLPVSVAVTKSGFADLQAPRSVIEASLHKIWHELLPQGSVVGMGDDFFSVGGNSLTAVQLGSRIMKNFGVPIQIAELFRHRTVAEQASIIEMSVKQQMKQGIELRSYPRCQRHRLSSAQERMWFLQMLEPDSAKYNIPFLAKLTGQLNVDFFEKAVEDLVKRHEMLRTTFFNEGGYAFQIPHVDFSIPFQFIKLNIDQRASVYDLAKDVAKKSFRLEIEVPIRIALYQTSTTENYLLLVLHHIAGDAWSMQLMLEELSLFYTQKMTGKDSGIQPLQLQYIDYAESVRTSKYDEFIAADINYWTDRLRDVSTLELPTDALPEATDVSTQQVFSFVLSSSTTAKLKKIAKNNSSTPFEMIMTVLNILLSRLSDQQDIVVGFPVVNRQFAELESLVGLFLNTLVLRTNLSGDPSFIKLLSQVSSGIREAYEHQSAPFERLVEVLNPPRRIDRTPIFDVLLNYLGSLTEKVSIPGIDVESCNEHFEVIAKYALTFYIRDENDGMHFQLVYRNDLFSASRAKTILAQLCTLIEQVVESPESACSSFSLLSLTEQRSMQTAISSCFVQGDQRLVIDSILESCSTSGESIAIEQGKEQLTYIELMDRVEELARRLVGLGCSSNDIVMLTGPRGIGFVIGMLAIFRCGSVMFPVNPALPKKRQQQLISIAKPVRGIFVEDLNGSFESVDFINFPCLHIDSKTGKALGGSDPKSDHIHLPKVDIHRSAYLFFTSGTTGVPRGVLGWHGGLSHFLDWQRKNFKILSTDRCAQMTNVSFDVMLRDTLLALVSGGTLVVPEAEDEANGAAIIRWLGQKQITVLHAAPTVFHTWLLDTPKGARLDDLKWLFLAGEPLRASLVNRFRSLFPGHTRIVNLYGPTETTMAKFAYEVPCGPLPTILPVGFPLPECQGFIWRGERFCGVGEPGEVVIRTPYRTLGYFGNQEDRVSGFILNPYAHDRSDLLYRTGDLGRICPDGALEVLGRLDHQVKISGVRIQPAEIEGVLAKHPSVVACAVIPIREADGESRLVAYVVVTRYDETLSEQLRRYVGEHLPQAMVPGEYIRIDRIPTTANGKIDLAMLPKSGIAMRKVISAQDKPHTTVEIAIAKIWEEVLSQSALGRSDNFFELGGTSLKILRLLHFLEGRFPGKFRVAQLFSYPTIFEQARLVSQDMKTVPYEGEVREYDL